MLGSLLYCASRVKASHFGFFIKQIHKKIQNMEPPIFFLSKKQELGISDKKYHQTQTDIGKRHKQIKM